MVDAEEAILFSISVYSPPAAARVGEDERIIGGGYAAEQEEYLTLERRHNRACHFVSTMHR